MHLKLKIFGVKSFYLLQNVCRESSPKFLGFMYTILKRFLLSNFVLEIYKECYLYIVLHSKNLVYLTVLRVILLCL